MLMVSTAQTITGGCFVKGNEKLTPVLNQLLADELSAISQYMVHAEMCENWGFGGLHAAIEKQAMDEMHHAEWLIARILFLDGKPVVTELSPIVIGQSALDMITNDQDAEVGAGQAAPSPIRHSFTCTIGTTPRPLLDSKASCRPGNSARRTGSRRTGSRSAATSTTIRRGAP